MPNNCMRLWLGSNEDIKAAVCKDALAALLGSVSKMQDTAPWSVTPWVLQGAPAALGFQAETS